MVRPKVTVNVFCTVCGVPPTMMLKPQPYWPTRTKYSFVLVNCSSFSPSKSDSTNPTPTCHSLKKRWELCKWRHSSLLRPNETILWFFSLETGQMEWIPILTPSILVFWCSKLTAYVCTFATAVYSTLYLDYKPSPSGREHCFSELQRRHRRWIDRTIYGIIDTNTTKNDNQTNDPEPERC